MVKIYFIAVIYILEPTQDTQAYPTGSQYIKSQYNNLIAYHPHRFFVRHYNL